MQPINKVMIYYRDKKLKKRLIDLMSLAQRMYFLPDLFQMTAIALVSAINHCHGLYLFWDTLYLQLE